MADGYLQGLEIGVGSSVADRDLLGLEVVRSSVGGSVGLANGNLLGLEVVGLNLSVPVLLSSIICGIQMYKEEGLQHCTIR